MVMLALCNATFTLLQWLDDPLAAALFTRGCELLSVIKRDMVGLVYIMQGMLILAWKIGHRIPRDAARFFEKVTTNSAQIKALELEFVLPVQPEARPLLAQEDIEADGSAGADVASLLEKWSELQIG